MAAGAGVLRVRRLVLPVLFAVAVGLIGAMYVPSCDEKAGAQTVTAKIAGKTFFLEVAADEVTRLKGLMGRTHIDDNGGMVFVFPPHQVRVQGFWMKNCLTDIDILYLDGSGRVLATHTMKVEPPRRADETEKQYEDRCPTYSSKYPSPIAVEVKAGTIASLGVKPGDKVELDVEGLKKRAR
jgi:uncharacterized membrane protein (UPF0127 family)